jgi:NitT/TauT family transport system ATP-binding protein
MIRLAAVSKVFDNGVRALDAVDLRAERGEFVTLLGPSGCGKSTLLRIIAGLETPTSGQVTVGSPRVGYVFQDAHLLPWRTVLANVALPLELMPPGASRPATRGAREGEAARVLGQVGLADALALYPAQLSGGMRMRVSLARALVTQPEILLLDEPFAALDEVIRHQLGDLLRGIWRERGLTVVFVTHAISEAARLSQRALVISRRPGRVLADRRIEGPPEQATRELLELFDSGDR